MEALIPSKQKFARMTVLSYSESMQILHFKTSADFRFWLDKNHAKSDGLWLRIFKRMLAKNP